MGDLSWIEMEEEEIGSGGVRGEGGGEVEDEV